MSVSHDALRSAAKQLGRFTRADLAAELGITPQRAGKRLEELVLEGIVRTPENPEDRVRRTGVGRPQHVYEYAAPGDSPGISRVKRATPEAEVAQRAQRARGDVVTGRKKVRGHRRETDRLIRQAEAAGATFKKAKHGHKVILDGKVITSVPTTPSDHRSTKNTKADLKRAGIA